ncbi:mutS protein homolog 5-like isoform X2 [Varroa destructor]|uniref:DNA mismatch repair proteins mutS family domain-containing protein n=1 Tax=Varroa destructor TaxID=109461 RepID=A0A7M7KAG1_VARDE|nr:mutS protein homolog 5-like isoform X2 [Varroa destructor]
MIYLRTVLDLSQDVSLRSIGALLQWIATRDYLQLLGGIDFQTVCRGDEDSDVETAVPRVVIATLGMYRGADFGQLVISYRTLRDLHVFSAETPSTWRTRLNSNRFGTGSDGTEDLSVFQLFERHCSLGRSRLRSMFLAPPNSRHEVEDRLTSLAYFSDPENRQFIKALSQALRNIKRVDYILLNMCRGETPAGEWRSILSTCKSILVVQDLIAGTSRRDECPALVAAFKACDKVFAELVVIIENVVDFQGCINYVPCMGFVFRTKRANERAVKTTRTMELVASMDDESFFRCNGTALLHEKYGNVYDELMHLQHAIYRQLQRQVLTHATTLLNAVDTFCTLDATLALALTGNELNFARPQITEENICVVVNGIHPLLEVMERSRGTVKANSWISVNPARVFVVTGPNSSGKSTFLRQCALIAFLAHLGAPVPAQKAKIALLDTIQSSFYSDETMRNEASGFAVQCQQIAFIMKTIEGARALVVVDEFGKGTQMTEGAGLCVAFLRQMALMPRRPHLLMASHYQRHLYAFLANNSAINFLTFSRHLAGNRLVQLYSVVPGITTSSFASFVSRDAGLVEEVVQHQEQISSKLQNNQAITGEIGNQTENLLNYVQDVLDDVTTLVEYSGPGWCDHAQSHEDASTGDPA